ncbi:RNA ligase, putative [Acanthamoeba castellanii str. Neff]|uniref:RNA ligase, putative n=1 Tax=Acanthamoeba castellanii (strain ATCC 30010 / Neff) TaxID=1257118 RepID=L8H1C3_ACACF|nr:RNA ligase, putative [Acanthamoeba castellanii str. Neff]ELR19017.1 RNA ligase, putative [Acanthamoeba castellanii str. Neff]
MEAPTPDSTTLPPKELPSAGPRFRRYASIENHQLEAETVRTEGHAEGEWVVMEKVHGSNFCFLTDGSTVTGARRKALLAPGDKYYPGWEILLEMYTDRVLRAFQLLQEHYAAHPPPRRRLDDDGKLHQLYVYGELFGGMYPGLPTPPTQAHVQKGIYYSPTYDFFAFDLHDGHGYLDYDLAERIFQTAGFFYGEALLKGTFDECLAYPHEFTTTLPKRLGHPPLVGARYEGYKNLAEGTVIKPVRNAYFTNGSRVILKKKIDLYAEIIDIRKREPVKRDRNAKLGDDARLAQELEKLAGEGADVDVRWLCDEFERYVNANRLTAVVSKIGFEGEVRHRLRYKRGQLIGLLAKDALDDLLKRPEARARYDAVAQNKARKQIVTRRLNTLAARPVALFFDPPADDTTDVDNVNVDTPAADVSDTNEYVVTNM